MEKGLEMKVYAYTVHISAPDRFTASAIVGTLWEVADEAPAPCAVHWISDALWLGDTVDDE